MISKRKICVSIISAFALCALVAVAFVLGFTFAENKRSNLPSDSANASVVGDGKTWTDSTANTYYISSEDDLFKFRNSVNNGTTYADCTVYLTKSFTLTGTWVPIGNTGTEGSTFKGTFDGQSFTISSESQTSGLYIKNESYAGFFGYSYGMTVKNLNLEWINFNGSYVGGVVAYARSGTTTIQNCSVVTDYMYSSNTGGIIGYAYNGSNLVMSGCNVTIAGTTFGTSGHTGGLAGCLYNYTGTVSISDCNVSTASYDCSISGTNAVGGAIGYLYLSNSPATLNIQNVNIDATRVCNKLNSSANYVGGLIGYMYARYDVPVTISGCNVKVDTISNTSYVGGFIGYVEGYYSNADDKIAQYTNNTVNFVNIELKASASTSYCGGFIGYNNKASRFENCRVLKFSSTNGGIYSEYKGTSSSTLCIGGFIGYIQSTGSSVALNQEFVSCEVNINNNTSGSAIRAYGNTSNKSTSNSASVSASSSSTTYAGGFVGYDNSVKTTFSKCILKSTNTKQTVYAYSYPSAYASTTSSTTSHTATASWGSSAYAGGLVAYATNSSQILTVDNCEIEGLSSEYGIIANASATGSASASAGSTSYTKSGSAYSGGLIGYDSGTLNCSNTSLKLTGSQGGINGSNYTHGSSYCYTYVGGLVGWLNVAKSISNVSIETSKITSYSSNDSSGSYMYSYCGGAIGYLSNATCAIDNVFVSGDVLSTGDYSDYYDSSSKSWKYRYGYVYVGGIIGCKNGSGGTISDCLVTSTNIKCGHKSGSNAYVGGIVGTGTTTVTRCGVISGTIYGYYTSLFGRNVTANNSFGKAYLSAYSNSTSYATIASGNSSNVYATTGSATWTSSDDAEALMKTRSTFEGKSYFTEGWTMSDSQNYNGYPTIIVTCTPVDASSGDISIDYSNRVNYSFATQRFSSNKLVANQFGIKGQLTISDNSNYLLPGMVTVQLNGANDYILSKTTDIVNLGYAWLKYKYNNNLTIDVEICRGDSSLQNQTYTFIYNFHTFTETGEGFIINKKDYKLNQSNNTYTVTYEVQYKGGYFPKFREVHNDWSFISDKAGDSLNNGTCIYNYTFENGLLKLNIIGWCDAGVYPAFEIGSYASSFNQTKNIAVTSNTGEISVKTVYDGINATTFITPVGNQHIHSITIDNQYEMQIEYYRGAIYRAGGAFSIEYSAKEYDNTLTLSFEKIYQEIKITVLLTSGKENSTLKEPLSASSGTKVNGVVVKAQTGGEARIVGNNIESGDVADDEQVVLVAVAYTGYEFAGWVASDGSDIANADKASIRLTKAEALNKIFIAQFVKIQTNEKVNDTLDNTNGEFL